MISPESGTILPAGEIRKPGMQILTRGLVPIAAILASLCALAGCSQSTSSLSSGLSSVKSMIMPSRTAGYNASARERECLARAMFFESNRSSRDGLVAVGSVVMNRKASGKWGDNICDVVGAKKQFAPGVLSRKMNSKALPDVMAAADAVLKGERHPKVGNDVMFFHTAGLKFPYKNMHYTTVAGGNAFYYKRDRKQNRLPQVDAPQMAPEVMVADAGSDAAKPTQIAFANDNPTPSDNVRTVRIKGDPKETHAVHVALTDEAPVPFDPEPAVLTRKSKAKPEFDSEMAFADVAPVPEESPKAKLTKSAKAQPKPVDMAESETRGTLGFEAPSDERFGGAMPAYSDMGNGTGILGQLVVQGN
jgi:hypothetical protein